MEKYITVHNAANAWREDDCRQDKVFQVQSSIDRLSTSIPFHSSQAAGNGYAYSVAVLANGSAKAFTV